MIDRKQIADMLGVKVPTFRKRIEARPDFPKPVLRMSKKTVRWDPADVNRWLARQRSAQA
jgi:predicted DNA-binding transcriptional regulator AlpA